MLRESALGEAGGARPVSKEVISSGLECDKMITNPVLGMCQVCPIQCWIIEWLSRSRASPLSNILPWQTKVNFVSDLIKHSWLYLKFDLIPGVLQNPDSVIVSGLPQVRAVNAQDGVPDMQAARQVSRHPREYLGDENGHLVLNAPLDGDPQAPGLPGFADQHLSSS